MFIRGKVSNNKKKLKGICCFQGKLSSTIMSGQPAFLNDIEKGKDLKKTTTAEKNKLPTKEDIEHEKKLIWKQKGKAEHHGS